jgi:DNA-binding CsgD family transcriptional regulator
MGTSLFTVQSQIVSAMRKLRAKNRGHAACKALRQGIIK